MIRTKQRIPTAVPDLLTAISPLTEDFLVGGGFEMTGYGLALNGQLIADGWRGENRTVPRLWFE